MREKRYASVKISDCVACGCCVKVCPRAALSVFHGLYAKVDTALCVGCGKCVVACPACVIAVKA